MPGCWPSSLAAISCRRSGCPTPKCALSASGRAGVSILSATAHRAPLAKNGPRNLRWALTEAATHACTAPVYRDRYQHTKTRLGKQRGPKVAQVDLARKLAEAIWHMLTRNQPFAPAGATDPWPPDGPYGPPPVRWTPLTVYPGAARTNGPSRGSPATLGPCLVTARNSRVARQIPSQ